MFLYVVKVKGSRWYKIGISYAPLARLEALQTANPHELELCAQFESKRAAEEEARLHAALRLFHLQGEWFHLPDGIAATLISGDWTHFDAIEAIGQADPGCCCPCVLCTESRAQKWAQVSGIMGIIEPQHESNS